jgi:hypothetical protein
LGIVLVDYLFEPNYHSGKAEKWRIHNANQEPLGIAIIWDQWINPIDAQKVVSFSMVTVNADSHLVMRQFHKNEEEKRTPLDFIPPIRELVKANPDIIHSMLNHDQMPILTSEFFSRDS